MFDVLFPSFLPRLALRVLCCAVRLLQRTFGLFSASHRAKPDAPSKILLIQLHGIGALVCASSAHRALRHRYPSAEITLLTRPGLETLYEGCGLYDRTETLPLQSGFIALRALLRRWLRRGERVDLAIHFDSPDRFTWLALCLSKTRATVGFVPPESASQQKKFTGYTVGVPLDLRHHARKSYQDLALAVDAAYEDILPVRPNIRASEKDQVDRMLEEWGVAPDALLVGIQMNAGEFARRRAWPPEKFVMLAQRLEELGEYRVVFLGSPEEESYVMRYAKQMPRMAVILAGKTSMRQLAATLSQLHLLVGNDSGTVHLAAALGVPTVSIFGPESPARFGPPKTEEHAVVWTKPDCGPCASFLSGERRPCAFGYRCVQEITLDRVWRVVNDMLNHLSDPENPPWLS